MSQNTTPNKSSDQIKLNVNKNYGAISVNQSRSQIPGQSHSQLSPRFTIKDAIETLRHSPALKPLSPNITVAKFSYDSVYSDRDQQQQQQPLINEQRKYTNSKDSSCGWSVSNDGVYEHDGKLSNAGAGLYIYNIYYVYIQYMLCAENILIYIFIVFSIVNLFLGLGLLSFPYALMRGSFTALIGLAFVCLFMCYTAKIIVRCFEKVDVNKRSYQQVGYEAMGIFGYILVSFGIELEFIGALTMSIIFFWNNIHYLLPNIPLYIIIISGTIVVIPTTWMLNMADLRFISLFGCISKLLTVAVIVINFWIKYDVVYDTEYEYIPTYAYNIL